MIHPLAGRRASAIAAGLALALLPARGALSQPPSPLTAYERTRARALLDSRLSCLGCHVIDGQGGVIGPDLSAGGSRSPELILRMIREPRTVAPLGIMPATRIPGRDARLVARYIAAQRGTATAGTTPTRPRGPLAGDGPALYAQLCAGCHGEAGDGRGANASRLPVPPAVHASGDEMSRRTDDRLYDAIAAGGLPLGRSARMPAFGASLTDAQIRALVRHIRTLCRCQGPAWSRDGS